MYIGTSGGWREKILKEIHDSSIGKHSEILGTHQRLKKSFYWPKDDRKEILMPMLLSRTYVK